MALGSQKISVFSKESHDPTTGGGPAPCGNATTWNSADKTAGVTLSNGDKTAFMTGASFENARSVRNNLTAGKWYWEVSIDVLQAVGDLVLGILPNANSLATVWPSQTNFAAWRDNGSYFSNGITAGAGAVTYMAGDTLMFALDLDNNRLFVGKNGVWNNSADPVAGTNPAFTGIPNPANAYAPWFSTDNIAGDVQLTANFGATVFTYTQPTGYNCIDNVVLTYDQQVLADGALGYYKLDECSVKENILLNSPQVYYGLNEGGTMTVAKNDGVSVDGTYNGSFTLRAPLTNPNNSLQGVTFNGTNAYIDTNVNSMALSGSFTIEAWMRPDSVPGSSDAVTQRICTIFGTGTATSIAFGLDHDGTSPRFSVFDGNSATVYHNKRVIANNGGTYHAVFVYNGISNKGNIIINGEAGGEFDLTPNAFGTEDILVGIYHPSEATKRYYSGDMAEFAIYNALLTDTRIVTNWSQGRGVFKDCADDDYGPIVNADSPSLYYRMGENSGTTAFDNGGSGNNITWSGTPDLGLGPVIARDINRCVQINSGDYGHYAGPVGFNGTAAATLECWVEFPASMTNGYVVSVANDDATNSFGMNIRIATTTVRFDIRTNAGTNNLVGVSVGTNAPHHLVFTYDGLVARGYVDGLEVATANNTSTLLTVDDTLTIGRLGPTSGSTQYVGLVDEVAVYNSVLTPAQIAQHWYAGRRMHDGIAQGNGDAFFYGYTGLRSGGKSLHSPMNGGVSSEDYRGYTQQAVRALTNRNKTTEAMKYLDLNADSDSFTVEAVIQFPSDSTTSGESNWWGEHTIIDMRNRGTSGYHVPIWFGVEDGFVTLGRSSNGTSTREREQGSVRVDTGQPTHIACVVNNDTVDFYVNGVFDVQKTYTNTTGACDLRTGSGNGIDFTLLSRARNAGDVGSICWSGLISDIAIYDSALSPTQLANHAALVVGSPVTRDLYKTEVQSDFPLSYWKLSDLQATMLALDESGVRTAEYVSRLAGNSRPGKFADIRQAIDFGVGSDYVRVVNSEAGGHPYTALGDGITEFSLEAWTFSESAPGAGSSWRADDTIIELRTENASNRKVPFNFGLVSTWRLQFRMTADDAAGIGTVLSPTNALKLRHAHHCVATVTSGFLVTLYVDGIQVAQSNIAASIGGSDASVGNTISNLFIGARSSDTGGRANNFPGFLQDVAIYTSVLTPTQVYDHYIAGLRK